MLASVCYHEIMLNVNNTHLMIIWYVCLLEGKLVVNRGSRMSREEYVRKLMKSYAVLSLPGLGYDCFRLFESILSGYGYGLRA